MCTGVGGYYLSEMAAHVAVIKLRGAPDAKWLISSRDSLAAGGPRVAALSEVSRENCS